MPNYLIIKNNKIENVIIAETKKIAELVSPNAEVIESTNLEPWIGWTRSGNTWVKPVEPVEETE
jgi:hypothetical protein